jgi:hypothetical protein
VAVADVNQAYVDEHRDDKMERLTAEYRAARQDTWDLMNLFTEGQLAAPVPTVVGNQTASDLCAGRVGHATEHITAIEAGFCQGV